MLLLYLLILLSHSPFRLSPLTKLLHHTLPAAIRLVLYIGMEYTEEDLKWASGQIEMSIYDGAETWVQALIDCLDPF